MTKTHQLQNDIAPWWANSEDPIGDAGRIIGELLALRVPHPFDIVVDRNVLATIRDEATMLLPEVMALDDDGSDCCLSLVIESAGLRLAEIRATYSPTQAFSRMQ